MIRAVPGILARIVERKREELARDSARLPEFQKRAAQRTDHRDFRRALVENPPAIIAEIKKASPSKGVFTDDFDPARFARVYAQSGAAALSVLTDREFFGGSLADLEAAREATNLPVLRKDFTLSEFHVFEAAAHGADAILLLAAILKTPELRKLRELASELGLASIIEVHDSKELDSAVASGADIIGVNNRDLNTFDVNLANSRLLAPKIPKNALKIAESGIHSRDDVRLLRKSGFEAFLVGERLMRSSDPAAALKELRS